MTLVKSEQIAFRALSEEKEAQSKRDAFEKAE